MSARLGEMLLKGGALTEAQLQEVLSAQAVYGGRLGTNLVEMGLLGEDDLARLLNEQFGVPYVDAASLDGIPPSLVGIIPLEMVERFRVLPVALTGKRLTLAMADPTDFGAIDEIGFVTGLVILPRVCSELRLAMALERYCGIKRTLRYIPVAGGIRSTMDGRAWEEAEQAEPDGSAPPTDAGRVATARRLGVNAVAERFAAASGEAEVVATLVSYLGEEFDRGGFLSLRCGTAVGVQAVADGAEVPGFAGCMVALEEAALLMRVLRERAIYLGEIPKGGAEGRLLAKIGGGGAPALLLPLVIGGVAAAVLIAEDTNGRLGAGVFELQRVAVKAELAFEMIGIRKRIGLV
ncbi:MAG TPA: hypothetical protein VIK40_12925 [Geomonas sp.]